MESRIAKERTGGGVGDGQRDAVRPRRAATWVLDDWPAAAGGARSVGPGGGRQPRHFCHVGDKIEHE